MSIEDKIGTGTNPVTQGHLFSAGFCLYSFYLRYIKRLKGIPMNGWHARAPFLRDFIWSGNGLFREDGSFRYSNADSFASAAVGLWMFRFAWHQTLFHGKELAWHRFNNPREHVPDHIHNAALHYYEELDSNNLPFINHNQQYPFFYEGIKFLAMYEEIREEGKVRLNKIRKKTINQKEIDTDKSITLQALGIMCANSRFNHRQLLGIPENTHLSQIVFEIHELYSGKILETQRVSLEGLVQSVKTINRRIELSEYPTDHKNCPACPYNIEIGDSVCCDRVDPDAYNLRVFKAR